VTSSHSWHQANRGSWIPCMQRRYNDWDIHKNRFKCDNFYVF